jgi:pimeloyl-ACP methyl ester carboxylesterase
VERVAQVAHDQNAKTFDELAAQYGIEDGPQRFIAPGQRSPLEYVRFEPQGDYDTTKARVLVTPMSIPVDPNLTMRAMRLFAANPTAPLIVAGAPAAIGNRSNRPNAGELPRVWRGDLRSLARPVLHYLLSDERVQQLDAIGYSYGADVAATTAAEAAHFGLSVDRAVLMESASTADRGLLKLGRAFQSSETPLQDYVAATASEPLFEARRRSDVGAARYLGGLLRLSNVAISHALARNMFPDRVDGALRVQADMRVSVVWGDQSELADGSNLTAAVVGLQEQYGEERVRSLVVPGMHHAGGDDIDLHAALVLQSLRAA